MPHSAWPRLSYGKGVPVPVPRVCWPQSCEPRETERSRGEITPRSPPHPMRAGVLPVPQPGAASPEGDFWREVGEVSRATSEAAAAPGTAGMGNRTPNLCQGHLPVLSLPSVFPIPFQPPRKPLETFNSSGKDGSGPEVILLHNTNPFHSLSPALWESGPSVTEGEKNEHCPALPVHGRLCLQSSHPAWDFPSQQHYK